MAIYKLRDIYSAKPEYGVGSKAVKKGKFFYVRQGDISSNKFPTFVDSGPQLINNDVLISRAGANAGETYIHKKGSGYVFAGFLVRYNFQKSIIKNKYFYYWTKTKKYKEQVKNVANSGSTMPKLNPPFVAHFKIEVPDLNVQKKIIDIIEPIENSLSKVNNQVDSLLKLVSRIPNTEDTFNLNKYTNLIRNSPVGTKQGSAKILSKRTTLIKQKENENTYKTNTFFCPKGTLVINTIRTYLEKFAILPFDLDCNGTLAQIHIKSNHTSILNNLLSNDFWKQCASLSKGTKMPVLNKKDLMHSVVMRHVEYEIENLTELLIIYNNLIIKLEEIKANLISLLVK